MKYLLVFLLLCPLLSAQMITYEEILEYQELCYTDSTLQHTHGVKWNDMCLEQKGDMASGYYFETVCKDSSHFSYIHKEPTFEGFINFINNKIKQRLQLKD